MDRLETSLKDTPRCLVLIALISIMIYVNSLANGFVWHDKFLIANRRGIIGSLKDIPQVFTHGATSLKSLPGHTKKDIYYRPVITLSNSLDHFLWGSRPGGYHLTSMIWHLLNGILIYLILNPLFKPKLTALLTSLFFIAHPVHTASVTYISDRQDVVCLAFMLIAWYLFIKDMDAAASGKSRVLWLLGVNTAFMLALFSKETAMVLPLLLILHIACFAKNKTRALYRKSMAYMPSFFVIIVFYLVLRATAVDSLSIKTSFWHGNISTLIFTMANVFADYIRLLFWPLGLSTSDTARIYTSILDTRTIAALAVLSFLLVAAVISYRRSRAVTFAISWFFITLLPASNIIPILYMRADHFLYIPSLGFSLLTAVAVIWISGFRRSASAQAAGFIVTSIILIFYSVIVIERNKDWGDEITLFTKTIMIDPHCREAHECLGFAYDEMGLPEKAFSEYRKALKDDPLYHGNLRPARVLGNMAIFYYDKGLYDQSESCYKRALSYEPEDANMHLGLGSVYFKKDRYDRAAEEFRLSLLLDPDMADARYDLGLIHKKMK